MYMKICLVGNVLDVITCATFQNGIFRGYDSTEVEFSIFLLIFEWALQQCSATAYDSAPPAILVINFAPWSGVKYCVQRVSVCICVCLLAYFKNHTYKVHAVFCTC